MIIDAYTNEKWGLNKSYCYQLGEIIDNEIDEWLNII